MIRVTKHMRWLALLAAMPLAGCAPAYRGYSGCYVDCQYCPPPPLPYTHYKNCVCHSCAASKYLSLPHLPVEENGGSVADR